MATIPSINALILALFQLIFIRTFKIPATPTTSPGAGTYSSTQSVTFSATNSDTIYYTNDGSTTPTCTGTGTLYSGAISTAATTTYKAIGCSASGNPSAVLTATYTISGGGSVALDAILTAGNVDSGHTQSGPGTVTSVSVNFTVGASATCLIVLANFENNATSATFTYNSVAMTEVANVVNGTAHRAIIYALPNPTTGTHAIAGSWTTAAYIYLGAVSFSGTNTSTCINASDTRTATSGTSLAIPATSTGATVATFITNGGIPTMNFTRIWAYDSENPGGGGQYNVGGTTTDTHTFTGAGGSTPAIAGVHVIP